MPLNNYYVNKVLKLGLKYYKIKYKRLKRSILKIKHIKVLHNYSKNSNFPTDLPLRPTKVPLGRPNNKRSAADEPVPGCATAFQQDPKRRRHVTATPRIRRPGNSRLVSCHTSPLPTASALLSRVVSNRECSDRPPIWEATVPFRSWSIRPLCTLLLLLFNIISSSSFSFYLKKNKIPKIHTAIQFHT